MRPGSKTIRVEKEGYRSEKKQTSIRKGRRSVVRFDLEQKIRKGWLTVSPRPSDALVRILNISLRYRKDMALDPGRYHVEVSANCYTTKQQWVELEMEDSLGVDIKLEQKLEKNVKKQLTKEVVKMGDGKGQYLSMDRNNRIIWLKFDNGSVIEVRNIDRKCIEQYADMKISFLKFKTKSTKHKLAAFRGLTLVQCKT